MTPTRRALLLDLIAEVERERPEYDRNAEREASVLYLHVAYELRTNRESLLLAAKAVVEETK